MARADAVRAVNPALFDRGWSKVSGSASGGIGRRAQMVRAARGHAPAIFKPIRQGGCHTGAQLRSQLTYLTTKSSFILDPVAPMTARRCFRPLRSSVWRGASRTSGTNATVRSLVTPRIF